eukprot:scaffold243_cov163-Ochromonas_danica.AAC.8
MTERISSPTAPVAPTMPTERLWPLAAARMAGTARGSGRRKVRLTAERRVGEKAVTRAKKVRLSRKVLEEKGNIIDAIRNANGQDPVQDSDKTHKKLVKY